MTKDEARKKVEEAKAKHEKKYGEGSAKIEEPEGQTYIVFVAYFPPHDLTYKQVWRGRYGLGPPMETRGRIKKEPRWEVRYAARFA